MTVPVANLLIASGKGQSVREEPISNDSEAIEIAGKYWPALAMFRCHIPKRSKIRHAHLCERAPRAIQYFCYAEVGNDNGAILIP